MIPNRNRDLESPCGQKMLKLLSSDEESIFSWLQNAEVELPLKFIEVANRIFTR